jgi:hypothetical protein
MLKICTSRDKYGFKKPTQWVKTDQLKEFEIKYQTVLQKQTKSWNKLFLNNNQQWPELCPERKYTYICFKCRKRVLLS